MPADAADNAAPPLPLAARYGLALALSAAATLAAVLIDQAVPIPNLSLVFVLPVVVSAAAFGWGPAMAAVATCVLAFNFFLIEPRHTLRIDEPANVWALVLLLTVAAIVSAVAAEARRRAVEARAHADQAAALQGLARALVAADGTAAIFKATAEALHRLFGAPAVVLAMEADELAVVARAGAGEPSPADTEAAGWSLAARLATRAGAYPVEGARYDFWPASPQAILGVDLSGREGRPADPERLVEIVSGYLAVALERERYASQAADARVRAEGQRLKGDLLAAVSHDLKTPLSTILLTLQGLRKFPDATSRNELLALAETETGRLAGLVGNLLDMSRLDADAVVIKPAVEPLADLIASAIARAAPGAAATNEAADSRIMVMVDYALAETALANVVENAIKYGPAGSTVRVCATVEAGMAVVEVRDQGPGFPDAAEPLFDRFARGVEGDGRPPGTGLGLAIARGFLEAQGGRIEACNAPEGGGLVRLHLPLAGAA